MRADVQSIKILKNSTASSASTLSHFSGERWQARGERGSRVTHDGRGVDASYVTRALEDKLLHFNVLKTNMN